MGILATEFIRSAQTKMVSALAVNTNDLIERASKQLAEQKLVQPPQWALYVKTGRHKERPPLTDDWWYVRSAAVLRSIYKLGPIGTSKLRTKYGGRKNRGYKPEHHYKGSGAIIRKILQQLETAEFLKQAEKGVHKGRVITPKGKSFLDKIAVQMIKEVPKEVKKEVKVVKAEVEVAPIKEKGEELTIKDQSVRKKK